MSRGAMFWLMLTTVILLAVAAVTMVRDEITVRDSSLTLATQVAGQDLITTTNFENWGQVTPEFRASLTNLLASPTKVATVSFGERPPPIGESASTTLILTNELGQGLGIRLRLAQRSTSGPPYKVLSYWKITEPVGPANGSQPIRPETNSTSSAAGSRR